MLYQIHDGTVSLGGETILSHFDFEIRGHEKIALVGKNGAGKTTLLRLLAGELQLDRDDRRQQPGVRTSRHVTVGFLSQQVFDKPGEEDRTVEEELLEACPCRDTWDRERFRYEQEYDRLFTGFGFRKQDKRKKLSEFSGGQRTRIALIRLMLEKPDILLLDEPTNHLDQEMLSWLEEWILSCESAVVMVSHDRYFLDQTAEIVYEIDGKRLIKYHGNYSAYVEEKQKNRRKLLKEWEQQQAEVDRLNDLIRKFRNKPRKASFARSRQKLLERMERMEKPSGEELRPVFSEIQPSQISAKYVLEAEELQIGYDPEHVVMELGLRIRRGQKIGVIGPNGIGKSTFLKTVAEKIPPLKGSCSLGLRVTMEYFDQQTASIEESCSVLEHFQKMYPSLPEKDARGILGRWLFGGKEAAKRVSDLSGGEKSRLIFAEIFQSCPNFMVLDEPTNHMDIQARERLEAAFRAYQGTLLFVSHDRYFISQVADALLVFEENQVIYYPFGYRHYAERLKRRQLALEKGQAEKAVRYGGSAAEMDREPGEEAGMEIGIGMRAEDLAMVESFRQVPEEERGRLKTISAEQMYRDWKARLMEEEMDALIDQAKAVEEEIQILELHSLAKESEMQSGENLKRNPEEESEKNLERNPEEKSEEEPKESPDQSIECLEMRLQQLCDRWTACCLAWDEEFGYDREEDEGLED